VRIVSIALALLALAATPTHEERTRGPFVLVSVGELGTITWRCGERGERYAIGYRGSPLSATTVVRARIGHRRTRTVVNPGGRIRFPLVRARRQKITLAQATEPGVLRATIVADFGAGSIAHCWSYAPPRVDLRLTPR
jgi:hypothetical protein